MNINITDKAKEMIKKTLNDKKINDPVIRIYIAGIG
jgi:Fe-S cluster assembly iron-binding protein IscA